MVRRAVAGVAIVVVVILMVVGIHSCQVSATNSALKNYNTSVGMLVKLSDQTGSQVFSLLHGASGDPTVQTKLDAQKSSAESELTQAQNLSVPDQVKTAQQNFLLTLSLRSSGVSDIAAVIQQALARSTAQQAVNSIATDMEKFLASDVVYTTQTATQIAGALHAAGIPVGGSSGETIEPTNFFPNVAWLNQRYIATQLGAPTSSSTSSTSGPNPCPSVCGHQLNSVSVGGVALSTGGGNTIPASPAPAFSLNYTNNGQVTQTNVTLLVTVTTSSGTTITAQMVVPSTKAGQTYDTQVTLPKAPPTGQAQVTAKVLGVPGETYLPNNTLTFPVTFD
jgi:hypothetical protein